MSGEPDPPVLGQEELESLNERAMELAGLDPSVEATQEAEGIMDRLGDHFLASTIGGFMAKHLEQAPSDSAEQIPEGTFDDTVEEPTTVDDSGNTESSDSDAATDTAREHVQIDDGTPPLDPNDERNTVSTLEDQGAEADPAVSDSESTPAVAATTASPRRKRPVVGPQPSDAAAETTPRPVVTDREANRYGELGATNLEATQEGRIILTATDEALRGYPEDIDEALIAEVEARIKRIKPTSFNADTGSFELHDQDGNEAIFQPFEDSFVAKMREQGEIDPSDMMSPYEVIARLHVWKNTIEDPAVRTEIQGRIDTYVDSVASPSTLRLSERRATRLKEIMAIEGDTELTKGLFTGDSVEPAEPSEPSVESESVTEIETEIPTTDPERLARTHAQSMYEAEVAGDTEGLKELILSIPDEISFEVIAAFYDLGAEDFREWIVGGNSDTAEAKAEKLVDLETARTELASAEAKKEIRNAKRDRKLDKEIKEASIVHSIEMYKLAHVAAAENGIDVSTPEGLQWIRGHFAQTNVLETCWLNMERDEHTEHYLEDGFEGESRFAKMSRKARNKLSVEMDNHQWLGSVIEYTPVVAGTFIAAVTTATTMGTAPAIVTGFGIFGRKLGAKKARRKSAKMIDKYNEGINEVQDSSNETSLADIAKESSSSTTKAGEKRFKARRRRTVGSTVAGAFVGGGIGAGIDSALDLGFAADSAPSVTAPVEEAPLDVEDPTEDTGKVTRHYFDAEGNEITEEESLARREAERVDYSRETETTQDPTEATTEAESEPETPEKLITYDDEPDASESLQDSIEINRLQQVEVGDGPTYIIEDIAMRNNLDLTSQELYDIYKATEDEWLDLPGSEVYKDLATGEAGLQAEGPLLMSPELTQALEEEMQKYIDPTEVFDEVGELDVAQQARLLTGAREGLAPLFEGLDIDISSISDENLTAIIQQTNDLDAPNLINNIMENGIGSGPEMNLLANAIKNYDSLALSATG